MRFYRKILIINYWAYTCAEFLAWSHVGKNKMLVYVYIDFQRFSITTRDQWVWPAVFKYSVMSEFVLPCMFMIRK